MFNFFASTNELTIRSRRQTSRPGLKNLFHETNTSADSVLLDSVTRARQSRYIADRAFFDCLKGEKSNIEVPDSHVRSTHNGDSKLFYGLYDSR